MGVCGGERSIFICLATVRRAVVGVVSLFAAAVVVMAIHVVLRSEDIRLSISHSYMEVDRLWTLAESAGSDRIPAFATLSGHRAKASIDAAVAAGRGEEESPPSSSSVPSDLILRVILSASNPGSRSKVECHNATVRLRALHPSAAVGISREIFRFRLDPFTVPQQTEHTRHQAPISDSHALEFILRNYHGRTSFDVMVQVDANITSYPVLGKKTVWQTYFCWPVTIGLLPYDKLNRYKDTICRTKE